MAKRTTKPDRVVQRIADTLNRYYLPVHPGARIDVYRYNPGSVRVRIIDPDFAGQSLTDRDNGVWQLLETKLPEEYGEVNVLLLLAPGEEKTSLMNLEFENPTPSRL
jgi:hypothetical protein